METAKPWLLQKFREILGFDEVDDVVELVMGMGVEDRKNYIVQFLGESKESFDFINEAEKRLNSSNNSDDFWGTPAPAEANKTKKKEQSSPGRSGLYKKSRDEDEVLTSASNKNTSAGGRKKKNQGGKKKNWKNFDEEMANKSSAASEQTPRQIKMPKDPSGAYKPVVKPTSSGPLPLPPTSMKVDPPPASFLGGKDSKKKSKGYTPAIAKGGGGKLKFQPYTPGDRPPEFAGSATTTVKCKCLGNEHKPLVNCMSCGRIACQREGWGACNFCKQPLLPVEEGGPLQNTPEAIAAYERAIAMKDKLIEFDRTAASRTKVVDDQGDYYSTSTSSWLTEEERGKIEGLDAERREAMHSRRRDVKVSIDIAGRRVVEQKSNIGETEAKLSEQLSKVLQGGIKSEENAPCQGIEISQKNIKSFGFSARAQEVYEMLCLDAPRSDKPTTTTSNQFGSFLFPSSSSNDASSTKKGLLKVQHDDDDVVEEVLTSDILGDENEMDYMSENIFESDGTNNQIMKQNGASSNKETPVSSNSLKQNSAEDVSASQQPLNSNHQKRVGGRGGFRGKRGGQREGRGRGRGQQGASNNQQPSDKNTSQQLNGRPKNSRGRNRRGGRNTGYRGRHSG